MTGGAAGRASSGDDRSPIWRPGPAEAASSNIARFGRFVTERTATEFGSYLALWQWSAGQPGEFRAAVWDFFDIQADGDHGEVLADGTMPGARWFSGTRLNYAEQALPRGADESVAVTSVSEDGTTTRMTWAQLRAAVGALAGWLREAGVSPGDRVVGYLPNTTQALIAFLASASIGAVWSACAQDYSGQGAAARFSQLEPVILFAADGYLWNGQGHDRRPEVRTLQQSLPTLRATIHVPNLGLPDSGDAPYPTGATGKDVTWQQATETPAESEFERVAFDAPLWVLFSSGHYRAAQVGEPVVTRPMPSMPLYFWNDPDGVRYRDAYFSPFPGVWRDGDWMLATERGSVVVTGRSDSTLNRHGVRLGSSDIYAVIDKLPQVSESPVIGAELGDGAYWLVLFVVLAPGAALSEELTQAIKAAIRAQPPPRTRRHQRRRRPPAHPHTRTPAHPHRQETRSTR